MNKGGFVLFAPFSVILGHDEFVSSMISYSLDNEITLVCNYRLSFLQVQSVLWTRLLMVPTE